MYVWFPSSSHGWGTLSQNQREEVDVRKIRKNPRWEYQTVVGITWRKRGVIDYEQNDFFFYFSVEEKKNEGGFASTFRHRVVPVGVFFTWLVGLAFQIFEYSNLTLFHICSLEAKNQILCPLLLSSWLGYFRFWRGHFWISFSGCLGHVQCPVLCWRWIHGNVTTSYDKTVHTISK